MCLHGNIYKTFKLSAGLLFVLLLFLLPVNLQAQTYPVQTNVYLVPPHGRYLSDYYSTSREKLVVQLLNRDMQRGVLEVRLRMSISAVNGLRIQNREEINYPTITLDAGVPTRLTQDDLLPYFLPQNLLTSGYFDRGKLPDGMIEFTFQAVEKYTGKVLSAPATARCWLTAQKPPLLSLPANDENIAYREPLQMLFQWTPQHRAISMVEYEFELRELPDYGAAPQSSFLYAPVIHSERLLHTTLVYDITKTPLDPDKLYGWRVRAVAKDGIDELNLFENSGYSEIRWFRTSLGCEPPQNLTASFEDISLNLSWLAGDNHSEFTAQIRNAGSAGEWTEKSTFEPRAAFYGLTRGNRYEYRVGAVCGATGQPVFSELKSITIPELDSAALARCGTLPEVDLSNQEPLQELKAGDVVIAGGDFPMTVTRATGGNGTFSGEGWIPVKWIFNQRWAVEFTDLQINTDYRQIGGVVNGKYDKSEPNSADLDYLTEGGAENTHNGIIMPDITLDFTVPENPVFTYSPETGEITVYTADGQEVGTVQLPQNEGKDVFPLIIKDRDGNIYQVEEEQTPSASPEGGETSQEGGKIPLKVTPLASQGEPLPAGFDTENISASIGVVTFANTANSRFAFDNYKDYYKTVNVIENNDIYEHLYANRHNGGNSYDVGWKLLPEGETDEVQAEIEIRGENIAPEKVFFSTTQGTRYKHTYDNSKKTYTLTVPAGADGDVQEIYAVYPVSKNDCRTLGKLNIITYKKQTPKVKVVFINDYKINTATLKTELDRIYKPVGVDWQVETDTFSYSAGNATFLDEQTSILQSYTEPMTALQNAYAQEKGTDRNTCYIFVLNYSGTVKNRNTAGFMPRGKQFGYIFLSNTNGAENSIIAHELGHGLWKLRHTFDDSYGNTAKATQGTTDNLMDYSANAARLAKWQWDIMRQPAIFDGIFDGDEEGMSQSNDELTKKLNQIIETLKNAGENACSFIRNNRTFSNEVSIELPSSTETLSIDYLIGKYENENINFNIDIGNFEQTTFHNYIQQFKNNETKYLILYINNGEPQICEATEDYSNYVDLVKAKDDMGFLHKFKTDLLKCKQSAIPDLSTYKAKSVFTTSNEFNSISNAVQEKLNSSFFGNVKLCVELSSSDNDFTRLTTAGIDYSSAEIKLGIHIDYANNQVLMKLDASDSYLQTAGSGLQAKIRQYGQDWGTAVDMAAIRQQAIADLEEPALLQDFFDKLVDKANTLLSDKIASVVEGVQTSQKIAKNVWDTGEINRSTWHSTDGEHKQWPQYARFAPVAGGVTDGVIGEITGIPLAIKGIYGIMTDREQQQAIAGMFSKEGMSQLWEGLKSDAAETLNDGERTEHFVSRTTIEIAAMLVPGMQISKAGKLAEVADAAGNGMKVYENVNGIRKKVDDLVSSGSGAIKKDIKEFCEQLEPDVLTNLLDEGTDIAVSKGRKLSLDELKALWKRGNDFNRKGRLEYGDQFSEIQLGNGKRLDTYIPGEKIISRKATDLDNITEQTWKNYCNELVTKYKVGTIVNSTKLPNELPLSGKYYLEIPLKNQSAINLEKFKQIAKNYGKENGGIDIIFLSE